MAINVVILAAGQGKRMHSSRPKVLHTLGGMTLIERVIATAKILSDHPPIVVYGHEGEQLKTALAHEDVRWVEQKERLGTGHAVQQALPSMSSDDHVLILCGDVPLISSDTLLRFIQSTPDHAIGLMTVVLDQPYGYGRIKRDQHGNVLGIVEEKDADENERAINEINTGIYYVPAAYLQEWLPQLKNYNAQHEYYLTDIIILALQHHVPIHTSQPKHYQEILGVNDRAQLAFLERYHQRTQVNTLMAQGVTFLDPDRVDIRGDVQIGRDVIIDINVILEGMVIIGDGCVIGPHSMLKNTTLGKGVDVKAYSMLDGAIVGAHSHIGPFARLRPDSVLAEEVHIGNFVEVKKTVIGKGSKANHLTYLGDAEIGMRVNVGAGTITCNYDGVNKHKTHIGDGAFIGSNSQLVAPVTIGAGATIGAGSTITKDAPSDQLTLARAPQQTIAGWKRPSKETA